MVNKRKGSVNNKVFVGLILLLLVLSPFLAQKVAIPSPSDNWIRLSDREVFAWLDVTPKESDQLNFSLNQSRLSDVKTSMIPMFPYDNPFFLVMVDSAYQKDIFYKDTLLAYLKNKKYEIFTFDNSWVEALMKARKKAETIADPSVLILIGSLEYDKQVIYQDLIRSPLFYWTNTVDNKNLDLARKIVSASGGEIYPLSDPQTLEKMDIKIHAPVPDQKIQFFVTIPFLKQFYSTKLEIQTLKKTYSCPVDPTDKIMRQIKTIYRVIFLFFLISSLFVLLNLVKKSRKKWKKNQKKKNAKKAQKKFCISWLEESSKSIPGRRIDKSPFTIGVSSSCDFSIQNDSDVSAKHCQIVESKCAFYLFDMQSRNGTYVNGEKILQKQLSDKDKIGIGKTILIFHKSALQYTSDEKIL